MKKPKIVNKSGLAEAV